MPMQELTGFLEIVRVCVNAPENMVEMPDLVNYFVSLFQGDAVRNRQAPRDAEGDVVVEIVKGRKAVELPFGTFKPIRGVLQRYTCQGLMDLAGHIRVAAGKRGVLPLVKNALEMFAIICENEAILAARNFA